MRNVPEAAIVAKLHSAAAPEVHRSPSAVSMQLKKLESALGCQLLPNTIDKPEFLFINS
ncbi:LysR family transcriptional regulator [Hafnia paralvei]|uniref:helix-turn-helix domain-containing protein n=1 Tax=Hafnia paralvei TaxID=546367 RepID=UPI002FDC04F8